jgi:DNA polymerase III epsilon subunit family exonuclease
METEKFSLEDQLQFFNNLIWIDIPEKFYFIDVETTGLDIRKDSIVEIGAIEVVKKEFLKSGQVNSYQCFIKIDGKIPEEITKISGITDEMLLDGKSEKDALLGLIDFVEDGYVFGFNSDFDSKFLNKIAKKNNLLHDKNLFDFSDVLKLARKFLKNQTSYKLSDLARKLGSKSTTNHRAIADCINTFYVYLATTQVKLRDDYHSYFMSAQKLKAVGIDVSVEEMIIDEKTILNNAMRLK